MAKTIVCFGNSLTSCGGSNGRCSDVLQDRFPDHTFINKGVGGESFVEARERLEPDVLALKPDIVLIEFGANDWWRDERTPEAWAADLEEFVVRIKQAGAHVVILGVFGDYLDAKGNRRPKTYGIDERAAAYRQLEAGIAEKHRCGYVANIQERIIENRCAWSDRNHPNELGNRFVADAIEPVLWRHLDFVSAPVRKPNLLTTRDLWVEAVALAPIKIAVVDHDRRLTYAEADERVHRIMVGLLNVTRHKHEPLKVALFLPNCLEYYLTYWAVVNLGGVIVPLNTWLKEESLAGIFRNVEPDVLIVRNRADADVLRAAQATGLANVFALEPGDSGLRAFDELMDEDMLLSMAEMEPDAPSIIMHTSGTTGVPKGAVMRHCDLMFNVMAAINAHQFSPSDVHLLINPMFHCTALYSMLPAAAYQKSTLVITADSFPSALMRLVEEEMITTFLSIPSIFQRIVSSPDVAKYDVSGLRLIAYAGSMMPVSTIRQLQKHFPDVELHNFFGLTETISMTHVLNGVDAEARPDSIGRLLPFVYARVVDEDREEVPRGTVGELLFARENVISGYYNQPGQIEESLVTIEGKEWFNTGDLASVDEDGFFFIKGRKKDMIIVGGENVYASEVEGVLMAHDGVREAAVKGVPATGIRASLGELIKAYVVTDDPTLTEKDLRRHCHACLASYKIPHIVQFVDALPRNPAGKVVKAELG